MSYSRFVSPHQRRQPITRRPNPQLWFGLHSRGGSNAASELTSLTYKQGATTLGTLTYTYDLAGNRLTTGGTFARTNVPPALTTTSYNANNQQTTFGTTTETYDLNGNLATSTDAGVTTTYTWNARNQLTGISKTGLTASFTYDSLVEERAGQ